MPTKVDANLESPPQINVTSTPKSYDTSLTREFLTRGIGAAAEATADHFNRTNLSNAQRDIENAAAGALEGGLAEANKKEALLQQMMSADEGVVERARSELDELRLAREQGTMDGPEREIRVNQLVKWYSNQYPHLAGSFRTMGSSANENVAGALRASAGDDPVQKGRDTLIAEAIGRGLTPQQLIDERNALAIYDMNKKRAESVAFARDASQEKMFIATQDEISSFMTTRAGGAMKDLANTLKANPRLHTDQAKAVLEGARTADKQALRQRIAEYQTASGISFSNDQRNTLEKEVDDVYDSMLVQIGALGTTDNLGKWASASADALLAQGRERFTKTSGSFYFNLAASSPEAFQAAVASGLQLKLSIERLTQNYGGNKAKAEAEFLDLFKNNPTQMALYGAYKNGSLDAVIASAMGGLWDKGAPVQTDLPIADRETKRLTLDVYDKSTWQVRSKATANLAKGLDYRDIVQSPILMSDLKAVPEAADIFIEKATLNAMQWLGEKGTRGEMQLNLGNYNNPFGLKYGVNNRGQINTINKANETYRTIRDSLGAPAAQKWLDNLSELGLTSVGDAYREPTSNPTQGGPTSRPSLREARSTRATGEAEDSKALYNYTLEKGDELGLPSWLTKAFLRVESSDAKNLLGPSIPGRDPNDRAKGPLMVMDQTFNGINALYGQGALNSGSQNDLALAGLLQLKELYDKYGDNVEQIAGEYHGGPDFSPTRSDGQTTTGDYIKNVRRFADAFKTVDNN